MKKNLKYLAFTATAVFLVFSGCGPQKITLPSPPANPTNTFTPANTATPANTGTATFTATRSGTPTLTPTAANTGTATKTGTPTNSPTITNSPTATTSPTATSSPTPTVSPMATLTPANTPTTGPTPGVDLTFSVWGANTVSSTNPMVAYVANSLTNPTYTAVQTSTAEFFPTFNFNIPTADSPVYVELIYAAQGAPYASSGVIQPHVGDYYGFYQPANSGGTVIFACDAAATLWGSGNVPVTTGTTSNIMNAPSIFGSSQYGGCVQTGYGGPVTLTTGGTVDTNHKLYMAAYPDNSYARGGGTAANSGLPMVWDTTSVNGGWLDVRDTTFTTNTPYFVEAWYDSNGLGTSGCGGGLPCPHQGDPIYVEPVEYYALNGWEDVTVTLSYERFSCSSLGTLNAGTTSATPNTGGILFDYLHTNPAASVTQLSLYLPTGTGSNHYETGIYTYNGYGVPGVLLGETGYQPVTGAGWNTSNLNTTVSLAANTDYYIGFYADTNYASGPSTVLPTTLQWLTNIITGWTPGSTTTGSLNMPSFNASGAPTYNGGNTNGMFPYSTFASVGVPCN